MLSIVLYHYGYFYFAVLIVLCNLYQINFHLAFFLVKIVTVYFRKRKYPWIYSCINWILDHIFSDILRFWEADIIHNLSRFVSKQIQINLSWIVNNFSPILNCRLNLIQTILEKLLISSLKVMFELCIIFFQLSAIIMLLESSVALMALLVGYVKVISKT